MAADFRRFYNIDIHDLVTGRLSPRYALALLEHLPPDSAFMTALRGGPEWLGWDRNSDILAHVYDAIQHLTWIYASANSKKKPKQPEPFPRPGAEKAKKEKRRLENPLLRALRGEELVDKRELGPGSVIPVPPNVSR